MDMDLRTTGLRYQAMMSSLPEQFIKNKVALTLLSDKLLYLQVETIIENNSYTKPQLSS